MLDLINSLSLVTVADTSDKTLVNKQEKLPHPLTSLQPILTSCLVHIAPQYQYHDDQNQ